MASPHPTRSSRPSPPAAAGGKRWLRRLLRRLMASEQQLEAERLQHDATRSGCTLAAEVERGQLVRLTGQLRTVVYTPRTNLPTLEAELYDGSSTVTLVWLGRRRIPGIEPGQALTVRGRIALRDERCVIYNPYYEICSSAGS